MNRLLASLLFATSLPAMAQIYVYTDAQGNPTYTNEPPENVVVQPVNLQPTNTMADTPDDSSTDQPTTATPASTPANTQPASSAASNDDGSGDGDAYDNQQELRDDVDVRRAAAIDATTPGPARIDTPAVDAVVPGPGKIEEGVRR